MNSSDEPIVKDVVLVGAGHAHVGVLRMFGMKSMPGVRFTLITRADRGPAEQAPAEQGPAEQGPGPASTGPGPTRRRA